MSNLDPQQQQANRFLLWGFVLFFLGLVVGMFIPLLRNPRMGLSTHLEGVMNGLFLVVLGLVWNKLVLPSRVLRTGFWLAIYGTFANYLAVLIAAITGAGKMIPIAGGKEGVAAVEAVISVLLITLSLSMLAVTLIVIYALYRMISSK